MIKHQMMEQISSVASVSVYSTATALPKISSDRVNAIVLGQLVLTITTGYLFRNSTFALSVAEV